MSEQETMSKDAQKTVVAFVAGLLVGGLLMWVFASPNADTDVKEGTNAEPSELKDDSDTDTGTEAAPTQKTPSAPTSSASTSAGNGDVNVNDQAAGSVVVLSSVMFPSDEGWVGVRDYQNGQLGGLLGVARFSAEQGLAPTQIELLRPTVAGMEYAVVFYSESGDREFSLANDVQIDADIVTFKAK